MKWELDEVTNEAVFIAKALEKNSEDGLKIHTYVFESPVDLLVSSWNTMFLSLIHI